MITIKTDFWKRWEKANEIEKQKIVAQLPIFTNAHCPLFTPNVINSYFEDLYLYLKKPYEEPEKDEG